MKKNILFLSMLVFLSLNLKAQKAKELIPVPIPAPAAKAKDLTVTLPLEAWQAVLNVIDKSNAGHMEVKQVQEIIIPQLQRQLADTTKKR